MKIVKYSGVWEISEILLRV